MPMVMTDAELDLYGLRSVLDGGKLFCGVTEEAFAINGVRYQWPRGATLSWGIGFTKLGPHSAMDVKDIVTACLKEISDCCDIKHIYLPNFLQSNIKIISQRLDGASGVLADCQIPMQGSHPNSTQLTMRLDDSESWVIAEQPGNNVIDLYRVVLHELEHGHGLGHKPSDIVAPALIAPIYSRTLRNLQKADKDELILRYAPPTASTPSTPTVTPGAKPVDATVTQDGKTWKGSIPRIA